MNSLVLKPWRWLTGFLFITICAAPAVPAVSGRASGLPATGADSLVAVPFCIAGMARVCCAGLKAGGALFGVIPAGACLGGTASGVAGLAAGFWTVLPADFCTACFCATAERGGTVTFEDLGCNFFAGAAATLALTGLF